MDHKRNGWKTDSLTSFYENRSSWSAKEVFAKYNEDVVCLYTLSNSKEDELHTALRSISENIRQGIFRLYKDSSLDPRIKLAWYVNLYMDAMSRKNADGITISAALQQADRVSPTAQVHTELEYQLSLLLIEMMNIVIYEMKDQEGKELWNWNSLKEKIPKHEHDLFDSIVQHHEKLYRSKTALCQSRLSDTICREYWRSIQHIERQTMGEQQRLFLVKAWVDFMEKEPELIKTCMNLSESASKLLQ